MIDFRKKSKAQNVYTIFFIDKDIPSRLCLQFAFGHHFKLQIYSMQNSKQS